jgi:hypothetical protein
MHREEQRRPREILVTEQNKTAEIEDYIDIYSPLAEKLDHD